MRQSFTTVPFKTESSHGLTHVNGVAKFSPAGIILEYESKLLGLIGSGVKEVRLPLGEILDIKFRKGIFRRGSKIEVRTRTFAKIAELPNTDGKLILKLTRDDFDCGKEAVEQIQKELASLQESLPPPQTPVSELFTEGEEDETKPLESK